jgi:putative transposase
MVRNRAHHASHRGRADAHARQWLIRQLKGRARSEGLQLTGECGLLARLTKTVVEAALEGELDDHLGYEKHDPAGRNGGNSRNGRRGKTVLTDVGPVENAVPRDRDGSFAPQLVANHQRRLSGVYASVLRGGHVRRGDAVRMR